MTSPVLFSTGAAPTSSGSRNLVEFKAGKMEVRGKMVHPIKRQGLVYLRQSPDDNLMHIYWKDRQSGLVEDDLILFPDDCEFKRVKECTTGRVYVLKMKSSNKNTFFWMQESRADRDEDLCKKINDFMNNPPRGGSDIGGSSERDLQSIFGNMTQEQVAQILSSNGVNLASLLSSAGRSPSSNSGGSASSTASTTNSAPTSATSLGGINSSATNVSGARESCPSLNDLRALISNAIMDENDEAQAEGSEASQSRDANQQQQQQQSPPIDLSTAVNSESLAHLLNDEEFLRSIEHLLPPITTDQSSNQSHNLSSDELKRQFGETVRSSQFRSALSQFCMALQSGQLGPLMSQFGLSRACVEAANLGNLEAFFVALDAHTSSSTSPSSSGGSNSNNNNPSSDASKPPCEKKKDGNN